MFMFFSFFPERLYAYKALVYVMNVSKRQTSLK